MKKYIILIALSAAMLTGCTSNKAAVQYLRAEISWAAFCKARGYDINDHTYYTVNEYLDCWHGSAEEEEVLTSMGIEPY